MVKPELKPLEPTTITRLLRGLDLERQRLVKLHEQRMKDNDQRRKDLQNRCPHNWQYDPGPNGYDSSYDCAICGAYSRSKP